MRLRLLRSILFGAFALVLGPGALAVEPAPDVRAEGLNGSPFALLSLRGSVVVLDFWASWCGPCRKSFPRLDELQAKYGATGVRVVGLTLEENRESALTFLQEVPVRFAAAWDPSGSAGVAFRVVAMPTTFLIDRDGRIVARFEGGGARVHQRLEAAVAALVAGKSLPLGSDVLVPPSAEATGTVKAWQRTYLADPVMALGGDALARVLSEHVHASKEAASGDGGAAGGGCGCN